MIEILGEINIAYLVRKFTAMFKRKQYCYFLTHFVDKLRIHNAQCPVSLRVFLLPILMQTCVPCVRVCMPDTLTCNTSCEKNCLVILQYCMEV